MQKYEHPGYPHTIDNGHGERLTFLRVEKHGVEKHDNEDRLIVENELDPGCGPIMHVHYRQAESLTVVEGELGYQIQGEEEVVIGPGESVVFQPGQPHRFWAAGGKTLKCTGWISPPHNVEYFLGQIYESTRENGKGRPNDVDAAALLARYGKEYGMPAIPTPVQAVVFPVLRAVGRITGRTKRFDSGPAPLT